MKISHVDIIRKIFSEEKLEEPKEITKFITGQINRTFEIDGKYVIKIEGELKFARGIFWHQREILEKLAHLGVKVPKVLKVGEIGDKGYILMDRISGKNVIYDWINFTPAQKESMLSQLAEQLKIIHSVKFDKYAIPIYRKKEFSSLVEAIDNVSQFSKINKKNLLSQTAESVEFLEKFYAQNKSILEEDGGAVLVHNDMHLENIYHENGKLTGIIDWDWACWAPRDYELWRLVDFCRDPQKFTDEEDEPAYPKYHLAKEIKTLKKYYPELFSSRNLVTRVRLFLLDTLINIVADYQSGRWGEAVLEDFNVKVHDFYKRDWLEKVLTEK